MRVRQQPSRCHLWFCVMVLFIPLFNGCFAGKTAAKLASGCGKTSKATVAGGTALKAKHARKLKTGARAGNQGRRSTGPGLGFQQPGLQGLFISGLGGGVRGGVRLVPSVAVHHVARGIAHQTSYLVGKRSIQQGFSVVQWPQLFKHHPQFLVFTKGRRQALLQVKQSPSLVRDLGLQLKTNPVLWRRYGGDMMSFRLSQQWRESIRSGAFAKAWKRMSEVFRRIDAKHHHFMSKSASRSGKKDWRPLQEELVELVLEWSNERVGEQESQQGKLQDGMLHLQIRHGDQLFQLGPYQVLQTVLKPWSEHLLVWFSNPYGEDQHRGMDTQILPLLGATKIPEVFENSTFRQLNTLLLRTCKKDTARRELPTDLSVVAVCSQPGGKKPQ